jgi:methyl-accepting chemotaxis protein
VEQAGSTMNEIVIAVKRVTDIMSEIAAASIEQIAGIEQANDAITQMDDVTQQNAALVEEATAAAESMREQSSNLTKTVSLFRLKENPVGNQTNALHSTQTAQVLTAVTPQLKERKWAKAKDRVDSDWNEF